MQQIILILVCLVFSGITMGDSSQSRHILAEYNQCDGGKLDDREYIENLLLHLLDKHNFNVLGFAFHDFEPQGVTGIFLLAESHISIHTWPEENYAAVDFFTCGSGDSERVEEEFREALECASSERMLVKRRPNLSVEKHIKP